MLPIFAGFRDAAESRSRTSGRASGVCLTFWDLLPSVGALAFPPPSPFGVVSMAETCFLDVRLMEPVDGIKRIPPEVPPTAHPPTPSTRAPSTENAPIVQESLL